ncbi:MAG: energy transducer TonB [SAR324 cluster bacterium]|nr:energy transducer TonB [SAR324 cluster bacterium]MBL7036142.1 energy transducer TonB [SAR324 cluster bacterium]
MLNTPYKTNIISKFKPLCLALIFFSATLFLPLLTKAEPVRALVAPLSVLGDVSVAEQQILFNYLREQLNQRYQLVSHKVLGLAVEQGISSIDIEDCSNSDCVREVLKFIKNPKLQLMTDELFLFQLIRYKNETQLSLKYTSFSTPEITEKFFTQSCSNCSTSDLINNVDRLVQRMLEKLLLDEITTPETKTKTATAEVPKTSKTVEKQLPKKPAADPYIAARDAYNQHISKLLLDVTYALQIFRSGMFVQLEISIDSSGTVAAQKIIKSSGSRGFDETTMMTLEEIQFDPLPEAMLKYGDYVVILQIQNSR